MMLHGRMRRVVPVLLVLLMLLLLLLLLLHCTLVLLTKKISHGVVSMLRSFGRRVTTRMSRPSVGRFSRTIVWQAEQ